MCRNSTPFTIYPAAVPMHLNHMDVHPLELTMKLLNLILASTVVLAGVVSPALAQDPVRIDVKLGPTAEAINDDLLRRAKAGFNGAIVVEKDGKVVLKAGY